MTVVTKRVLCICVCVRVEVCVYKRQRQRQGECVESLGNSVVVFVLFLLIPTIQRHPHQDFTEVKHYVREFSTELRNTDSGLRR